MKFSSIIYVINLTKSKLRMTFLSGYQICRIQQWTLFLVMTSNIHILKIFSKKFTMFGHLYPHHIQQNLLKVWHVLKKSISIIKVLTFSYQNLCCKIISSVVIFITVHKFLSSLLDILKYIQIYFLWYKGAKKLNLDCKYMLYNVYVY